MPALGGPAIVAFPPTIIVVHPREKRSKCTVEPLRGRPGFVFWTFPDQGAEPLDNYVRLGIGGKLLSPGDNNRGLLVLDGTWRLADRMDKFFRHVPLRSLPPIKTAYPRLHTTTPIRPPAWRRLKRSTRHIACSGESVMVCSTSITGRESIWSETAGCLCSRSSPSIAKGWYSVPLARALARQCLPSEIKRHWHWRAKALASGTPWHPQF